MISYTCVVNSNEHFFSNEKVSRTLAFSFFLMEKSFAVYFFKIIILFLHLLTVCVQVCTYVLDPANVWASEDSLQKLVLTYYHMCSGDGTQFTKLVDCLPIMQEALGSISNIL